MRSVMERRFVKVETGERKNGGRGLGGKDEQNDREEGYWRRKREGYVYIGSQNRKQTICSVVKVLCNVPSLFMWKKQVLHNTN